METRTQAAPLILPGQTVRIAGESDVSQEEALQAPDSSQMSLQKREENLLCSLLAC